MNKKCNREGGVGGGVMSKSQVQQNTREKGGKKENSWKEKTCETVFLLISGTHQMANIILDDGHFAKERERKGDGEGVHVPYYTVVIGENCNHLWLTWNTLHTAKGIISL